jgi:soluble lytic murein transglycosylase-like protein
VAQIRQESGFNPHARSKANAKGIAQLEQSTANSLGVNPYDPISSLYAAARMEARDISTYLKQGHDRKTAHKLALCAYNAGKGAVAKYHGCPPYAETQHYHKVIFDLAAKDRARDQQLADAR